MPGPKTGRERRRARLAAVAVAPMIALMAAACSSGGGGGGNGEAASGAPGGVTERSVAAVGTVYADAKGMTLYTADQESGGKILCTGPCLDIWKPALLAKGEQRPAGDSAKKFGTVKRSDDGGTQLTFEGRPLYTFGLDSKPGEAKGHGVGDDFGGHHFTWHAAVASAAGGNGTGSPDSGGGYGY